MSTLHRKIFRQPTKAKAEPLAPRAMMSAGRHRLKVVPNMISSNIRKRKAKDRSFEEWRASLEPIECIRIHGRPVGIDTVKVSRSQPAADWAREAVPQTHTRTAYIVRYIDTCEPVEIGQFGTREACIRHALDVARRAYCMDGLPLLAID